jgi:hypothetical protein
MSLVSALLVALAGQADGWKFDTVHRPGKEPLSGLVVRQGADAIEFKQVVRKPGSPTLVFALTFKPSEVSKLDLIDDSDRAELTRKLERLENDRRLLFAHLRRLEKGAPAEDLPGLSTASWPGDPSGATMAKVYGGSRFRLLTTAGAELAQLVALQLEQVFAAYAQLLPPRVSGGRPVTILLARSPAEYAVLAKGRGAGGLANPAFYDPATNTVVCASDLDEMDRRIDALREHHAGEFARIQKGEKELKAAYSNRPPADLLAVFQQARAKLRTVVEGNETLVRNSRRLLLERLNHEACHAYLASEVFPVAGGGLPRWLDEGLAQVFEGSLVEAGELRAERPDPVRLAKLRSLMQSDDFPPLPEVLRADAKSFLVHRIEGRGDSERAYLVAWGLAYWLLFDRQALAGPVLDKALESRAKGADAVAFFEALAGSPLPEAEKTWREAMRTLKSSGGR